MTLLDNLPDSAWFFCFPLSFGVFCITVLGIIHPFFWISIMRIYRSEVFVFMYVLVGFWSLLSCALLYAIMAESSCIYSFWVWYTMAFGAAMSVMMFLLFCGFCVLGMRRKSVCALLGLIYYLVTLYFVLVVNKQRKEVFGLQAHDCGECAQRSGAPRFHELQGIPYNITSMRTTTMLTAPTIRAMDLTASIAALLSAYEERVDERPTSKRSWVVDPIQRELTEDHKTTPTPDPVQLVGIARLSELLLNSDDCHKPRKPAHGRYQLTERRGSTLRVTLRCDKGYVENSISTQCKNNWWDRPIPQCRKRREPASLSSAGGCVMPEYPEHGEYRVAEHSRARPNDFVSGDNVTLLVTCDEPYRAVDPYVMCVDGTWKHAPPSCRKHCKLVHESTVDYKCLKVFEDAFFTCSAWQPDGATVVASCRPGHAHRGPFRYMRCRGDAWDHVVSCLPNANFTK